MRVRWDLRDVRFMGGGCLVQEEVNFKEVFSNDRKV
jgi:hypothetical protein